MGGLMGGSRPLGLLQTPETTQLLPDSSKRHVAFSSSLFLSLSEVPFPSPLAVGPPQALPPIPHNCPWVGEGRVPSHPQPTALVSPSSLGFGVGRRA